MEHKNRVSYREVAIYTPQKHDIAINTVNRPHRMCKFVIEAVVEPHSMVIVTALVGSHVHVRVCKTFLQSDWLHNSSQLFTIYAAASIVGRHINSFEYIPYCLGAHALITLYIIMHLSTSRISLAFLYH